MNSDRQLSPMKLVTMGLFTAVVCVVTMSFSIYVPATRGFFNIGDSMVFLTALLFGPIVGAFAGGVGSALADLFLGYSYYAPATLIIKGIEGFVVGWLKDKKPVLSQLNWKIYTVVLGVLVGVLLGYFGINYYSGDIDIALGSIYFTLYIPEIFWIGISILIFSFIAWLGWKNDTEIGWTILSTIIGGSLMVLGYYLYQFFIIGSLFQIEVVAIAELPINVGQMIVGIVITIPMIKSIKKYLPFLNQVS
jgi:uncharacterized membrane protein